MTQSPAISLAWTLGQSNPSVDLCAEELGG